MKYSVSDHQKYNLVSALMLIIKSELSVNGSILPGNIGGLCGVVGGYSLIGFTEMFYFVIKQTIWYFMRKMKFKFRTTDMIIYP